MYEICFQMKFFKSILKGKARESPHQDSKDPQEDTDVCKIVREVSVSEQYSIESEPKIEMMSENISDECPKGILPCEESMLDLDTREDIIVEYQPAVLLPSPEACQIRTLMKGFDQEVIRKYEKRCDANAYAGSILVELLEQYKVFEESTLISHGQQQNMLHIVEYVRSCISGYTPSEQDEEKGEGFEKIIRKVIKCLKILEGIARSYAEPGWVYRLAIDSSLAERLKKIIQEIHECFEKVGYKGTQEPKLENMHKFLLDHLKSYGNGSWSSGLIALRENSEALQSLASHLKISQNIMLVETYLNMNLPWALMTITSKDARRDESRMIYQEYCDSAGDDGMTSRLSAGGFEKYWMDCNDSRGIGKATGDSSRLFVKLDSDFDGYLTEDDFELSYLHKGVCAARSLIRRICGLSGEKKLKKMFDSFAMYGMGSHSGAVKTLSLDCARFAKLCRDSNMISKPHHVKELDIVFSKYVPLNCKRMDFEHFLASISGMSVAIGLSMTEICKRIMACDGPSSRCTKSSFVKLHDDRSLFTGIYARGGPDVGPVTVDMKAFVGRLKPKEKIEAAENLEITLPESPTMATASRVTSPGSRTPGRGASLEACEMRKSREMTSGMGESGKKKSGPAVAFGRAATEAKSDKPTLTADAVIQISAVVERQDE